MQQRCRHWITGFEAGEFRGETARAGRPCHRARLAVAAAIVFNATLLGACGGAVVIQEPLETSVPTPLKAGRPMDLDVLVYNIEYGGGPETDKVIRGPRRRRGRGARVLRPPARDRRADRVPLLQHLAAAPLEVPDPRAVGRRRPVRAARGPARLRDPVLQRSTSTTSRYGPARCCATALRSTT